MMRRLIYILLLVQTIVPNEVFENSTNVCSVERCKCQIRLDTFYMDCAGQRMEHTLANWPNDVVNANITRIIASFNHNTIKSLGSLPQTDVELMVSFAHNHINDLHEGLVINCKSITSMDLSYNKIQGEHLTGSVFKGLYNNTTYEPIGLFRLNLAHNELHSIKEDAFEHLVYLQWLDLSGNRFRMLDHITALSFRNLQNLEHLDLSSNDLFHFHNLSFVNLNKLQTLDISNNDLNFIPVELKYVSKTLRVLRIDSNPIVEITEDSLLGMNALSELYAFNLSQIEEIKPNAFSTLSRLHTVDLSHIGSAAVIENHIFSDSVRELNLSNSNLEILSDRLINWTQLAILDLRGNQLYCTCTLHSIVTKLQASVRRDRDCAYCFDAKRYKQYKIFDLNENICFEHDEFFATSYATYTTDRILRIFLLTSSVLLVICLFIALWLCWRRYFMNQQEYPFQAQYNRIPAPVLPHS